jgi:hypothetical protein
MEVVDRVGDLLARLSLQLFLSVLVHQPVPVPVVPLDESAPSGVDQGFPVAVQPLE